MFDEEDLKDWEIKDEEPPEALSRKWERGEGEGPQTVLCRSCKKETPEENLTCIFCAAVIFPENCFLKWIKHLFKRAG